MNNISLGVDIDETENSEDTDELSRNDTDEIKLNDYLGFLYRLKEYSLNEGHSNLFINTQKTIKDLEWIVLSANNMRQPEITTYFRRSI